jgi:biopolymer transport protein ExbB
VALAPSIALAWWNDEWTGRKPIRVDTSAAGASITDSIGSSAVLVRLHSGNFKFDQVKEDGSDLRFIAGDDKTPLPFHVEKFDSMLGEALVWVGIPDLKPGVKTELWVYYKNPKAAAVESAKDTFDKDTTLIYHFAEKGTPKDSTVWGNHATAGGVPAEGALIGRGLKLDGAAAVTIPAAPALTWAAGANATLEVWVKPAEAEESGVIFSRRDGDKAVTLGLDGGKPYVEIQEGATPPKRAAGPAALPVAKWHQLAFTAGDSIALYVDGAQVATVAAKLPALNVVSTLGGEKSFKGDLDELEIAKSVRPAGFLQVAALAQGSDPGKLIAFGQDEESAGWSGGGYFTIIIKSVTPDGWVVIALLGVMMAVSWLVMINKASYLGTVQRSNEKFDEAFRAHSAEIVQLVTAGTPLGDAAVQKGSTLYRLWRTGAVEVHKRSDGTRPLTAESIESIRASLDAALVRENQRLNERMVLLTIAISGGPFLGLLGTVVGVMITFASIAAAGDVNVNAIAPGIAAALVATVAGLAVAIPALFGYNWLLTRAKNITANQQVFADELVTRFAEAYSEQNIFTAHPPRKAAGAAS